VHVALGQALIIYMYALPYRANKSAVVTVEKPIGGGPSARMLDSMRFTREHVTSTCALPSHLFLLFASGSANECFAYFVCPRTVVTVGSVTVPIACNPFVTLLLLLFYPLFFFHFALILQLIACCNFGFL
jgi:hypothetical protein